MDWTEHDTALAAMMESATVTPGITAYTNPGRKHNCGVPYPTEDGNMAMAYPDIIFRTDSGLIIICGEVETADSVTPERALCWALFSTFCADFRLYVPEACKEQASALMPPNTLLQGY